MMADLRATLEKLSNEFGPSGHEKAVRELIKKEIEGLVDRLDVDAMGNLIAFKAGVGPEPRLKLMVSAHMDEIGFMVLQVEKSGLLRFAAWAGWMAGCCWASGSSSAMSGCQGSSA